MTRFLVSTATVALLTATPLHADLTVDEAWDIWKAQFASYGLTLDAAPTRDGDDLVIPDLRLSAGFPMGLGSAYVQMQGPRFSPAGDGRVTVIYPDVWLLSLGGEITGEGSLAMALEATATNTSAVMSGDPDNAETLWQGDGMTIRLVDLAVSGEPAIALDGLVRMGPYSLRNSTRIDDDHLTMGQKPHIRVNHRDTAIACW